MSRASWSKLGGGKLRRDCPGTGACPRALGLGQGHGVLAGLPEVPLVLRLSGVIHVVGGPDVLHNRILAALLRPEERVLQHPARAAREAAGCAACDAQPRRCRRAQVPKGSAHALGGNGNLTPPQPRPLLPRLTTLGPCSK